MSGGVPADAALQQLLLIVYFLYVCVHVAIDDYIHIYVRCMFLLQH